MERKPLNIYWDMFLSFAKIGLFTFGGGYAMLALIGDTCVERKGWITHEEMMDITVIGESTPGPIALNCATFVGYKQKGIGGAAIATLGMVLPSFVIIYAISLFLDGFLEIRWIASAFKGIKLAVGLLIIDAALKMIKKLRKDRRSCIIIAVAAAAMLAIEFFSLNFSSVGLMLAIGLIGLAVFFIRERAGKAVDGQ